MGDETERERRVKKGRIKGERMHEIWQRLGGCAVISMECNMAAICLPPFASIHIHSFSSVSPTLNLSLLLLHTHA